MDNYSVFMQMLSATMVMYESLCTGTSNDNREIASPVFAKMVVRCSNWARLAGLIDHVDVFESDPAYRVMQQYECLKRLA